VSTLVIDAGNTRLKWALADEGALGPARAVAHAAATPAKSVQRLAAPMRASGDVLVASVAGPQLRAALTAVARAAGARIRFLRTPARGGGVRVGYREPWRLGVDRFAGLVAAHHLFPGIPMCVAGVGTALTVDLLGRDGRHFGGAIIPSPALMVDTLLTRTYGIRRRAQGGSLGRSGPFGRSTRDAITQGARYAAAAAIDRLVNEGMTLAASRPPLVVLTGGGAPAVQPLLVSHCVGVPDLVLRGLAVLAREAPRPRR
jgi:type III pantothenate kinase